MSLFQKEHFPGFHTVPRGKPVNVQSAGMVRAIPLHLVAPRSFRLIHKDRHLAGRSVHPGHSPVWRTTGRQPDPLTEESFAVQEMRPDGRVGYRVTRVYSEATQQQNKGQSRKHVILRE